MVVRVLPVNDEPPVFESSFYSFVVNRISTGGVDIGQIVAVDGDQQVGGEISYSILSGDTDNFGVHSNGIIYLKDYIYAFEGTSFDLVVMANDGVFNSTIAVRIAVSGFLSIPEVAVIVAAVIVAAAVLLVAIIVMLLCCHCHKPRHSSRYFAFNSVSLLHRCRNHGGSWGHSEKGELVHPGCLYFWIFG